MECSRWNNVRETNTTVESERAKLEAINIAVQRSWSAENGKGICTGTIEAGPGQTRARVRL
jgi:hypothetical protein